jgi:hypothetical protein
LNSFSISGCALTGVQGIHARDIARINNTDPSKAGKLADPPIHKPIDVPFTARILRLLANHHIFTEARPDVFCSNRLSSVLDSGKSVVELLAKWVFTERSCARPDQRYDPVQSNDMSIRRGYHHSCSYSTPSHIQLCTIFIDTASTDEALKGSAYLTEAFMDPATAHSMKPTDSPWNIATKTDAFLFDWYDLPENEHLKTRFSFAMACSGKLEPPAAILQGPD